MLKHISMIIVDDDPASRNGLVSRLRARPAFHVLLRSARLDEMRRQVESVRPELILLNMRSPGQQRLILAGALHRASPESGIILMGLEAPQPDLVGLLRAGVSGFIMTGTPFSGFLRTIHAVARGVQVLPTELTRSLFGQLKRPGARLGAGKPSRPVLLSAREREVAVLVASGMSNEDIARELGRPPDSIEGEVAYVLARLGGDERLEVASFSQIAMGAAVDFSQAGTGSMTAIHSLRHPMTAPLL
ncbi:MAG: response regulator transcription factor [Gemmatimonadota bacterium]